MNKAIRDRIASTYAPPTLGERVCCTHSTWLGCFERWEVCNRYAVCEIAISDDEQGYWFPRCAMHNGQRRKHDRPAMRPLP